LGRGVNFKPQPPYSWGNNPQYPLNRRLDGLPTWSGHFGKEKNLCSLPGIKPQTIQSIGKIIIRQNNSSDYVQHRFKFIRQEKKDISILELITINCK